MGTETAVILKEASLGTQDDDDRPKRLQSPILLVVCCDDYIPSRSAVLTVLHHTIEEKRQVPGKRSVCSLSMARSH